MAKKGVKGVVIVLTIALISVMLVGAIVFVTNLEDGEKEGVTTPVSTEQESVIPQPTAENSENAAQTTGEPLPTETVVSTEPESAPLTETTVPATEPPFVDTTVQIQTLPPVSETAEPIVTTQIIETTGQPETTGLPETTGQPDVTEPIETTGPVATETDVFGTADLTPESTEPGVTTTPESTEPETTVPEETQPTHHPSGRPIVYQYPVGWSERVGDDFFRDAVFIGDSRTQGLQLYSDIRTATYYGSQGLNVYTATTNTFINENGQSLTIAQALARHPEFKKIYVNLGVNEYWMEPETYRYHYTVLIDSIMAANPAAAVYIYAVSPVMDGLQNSGIGLNNTKMSLFNQIGKEIAMSRGIYYIDADLPFVKVDGNGDYRPYLDWSESSDGIHLNGNGIFKLTEYLRTHTK